MSAPVSRASRRAFLITFLLIVVSLLLLNGLGEDGITHAATSTAEWAKSSVSRFNSSTSIPTSRPTESASSPASPASPASHSQNGTHFSSDVTSQPSTATDPCQDEPLVPSELKTQSVRGTQVLITGGAGFIGSNLADRLVSLGYKVRILDNLYTGFIRNVPLQRKGVEFIHGDILHPEILKKAVKDVEFVFHLAAMSKVLPSVRDPEMARFCTENNALGSWNVLNATRAQNMVKKVVYAGSSTYYGNRPIPHNEDAAADFLTPYAASKYEGEIQMQMFDKLFNVPTITNRFFMVYGPRQPTTGAYAIVTGVFARQASQQKPLTIEGDGTHFRDFIHVNDIVTGLILSQQIKDLRGGTPINLGSGTYFSVKDVADMISSNQVHVAERKNDLVGTLADTCRMKNLLKYNAKTDFRKEMSFMAQETMKGNVFAQEWVTPLLAMSVPFILPSGSPMLPWAETHSSLAKLLEKIEFVKDSTKETDSDSDKLISVVPFGGSKDELESQAQLLANTVYSLVRFGKVRRYIVAAETPEHLEVCQDYNMPCFDASSGLSSLVHDLLEQKHDVHVAALGSVIVDSVHNIAVAGADITRLEPNGGLIIHAKSSTSSSPKQEFRAGMTTRSTSDEDASATLLAAFAQDKSLVVKSATIDSLCTSEEDASASKATPKKTCPKAPVLALSCNEGRAAGFPGGFAGKVRALRSAGLWLLSECTHGTYCDKQQYVPLRWIQSPPDLSTTGAFC